MPYWYFVVEDHSIDRYRKEDPDWGRTPEEHIARYRQEMALSAESFLRC